MKAMKKSFIYLFFLVLATGFSGCDTVKDKLSKWTGTAPKIMYTCPMPEDSVFTDKPGRCPKCGMDLVKMETEIHDLDTKDVYTCPMPEDSVFSDKPGSCPKCGMDLVKVEPSDNESNDATLETLLKPTNMFVISSIPVTTIMHSDEAVETEAYGRIAYDTRQIGSISSRVAGRIEKLYIKYRYQKIYKGQHILDIYSPELLTAQHNLLFLLKNDAENVSMINAAKQKLSLLGITGNQLQQIMETKKPIMKMAVYSNYSGHIHDAGNSENGMQKPSADMNNTAQLTTEALSLKEGMYLQKGQTIFNVYNPDKAWVMLNIPATKANTIRTGNRVRIVPETAPRQDFRATISFIEPFYAGESKTLSTRVYFDNAGRKLPIGSQVRATIFGPAESGNWLPTDAVLSLGLARIVFVRTTDGFRAQKIETGMQTNNAVQIMSGLTGTDSVATNAQYLMDSESFIKVKN
jgi:Cu(I)/Ag(I) efflux system membrane fusion protein